MVRVGRGGAAAALAAVVFGGGVFGSVAGCGAADEPAGSPAPDPTSSAAAGSPSAGTGPVYRLAGSLCQKADVSALAPVFPKADKPITDTERLCATSRASATMAVSLSVDAELLKDASWAKQYFDTAHRLAKSTPTDVPGAGSGAFWTGDQQKVELFSYHGNLVLQIRVDNVTTGQQLAADLPERLARVAAGTFDHLTP